MRACKKNGRFTRPTNALVGLVTALAFTFGAAPGVMAMESAPLPVSPASVMPFFLGAFGGGGGSSGGEPSGTAQTSSLQPAAEPRPEQPAFDPLEALAPFLPPPGEWRNIQGLQFDRFGLADSDANALGVRGTVGSSAVLSHQTGSAYDPEGYIWYFWGGGAGAYGGNEVYRLDLTIPQVSQTTQPSVLDSTAQGPAANGCLVPSDGPASASTFDGFVWSPATQSFFVFPTNGFCPAGVLNSQNIWEFDPLIGTWGAIAGTSSLTGPVFAEYDPMTGNIFIVASGNDAKILEFDPVTGQLSAPVSLGRKISAGSAALNTLTDDIIVFAQEGVFAVSVANPGAITRLDDVPNSFDTASGATFDAQRGLVVLWDGSKNVRTFDPVTPGWTLQTPVNGPAAGPGGVFSKWIMIDELGVLAGYQNPAEGLWLYRLPTQIGSPTPADSPPVAFVAPNQISVRTGQVVNLNGSASFDPDGQALSYAWSFVSPTSGAPNLATPNQATTSFTPTQDGSYVVRLTVNDGSLSHSATATVTASNGTPVANAGANQTIVIGGSVTVDASGSSDPDGDTLSFSWSFTAEPAGSSATLSGAQSVSASFVPDRTGTYRLSVDVSDGGKNDSDSVSITVSAAPPPNRAPVANAGPDQTLIEGQTATLNGQQSADPDNDTLTYAWTLISAPAGSSANLSNASVAQPTLPLDIAGTYVASLVVDDGALSSAADEVTITADIDTTPAGGDPALVAHWELNENGGGTAGNSAGNGNGTVAGATWVNGVSGSGLSFDGNDHVLVDNASSLSVTGNAITLAAWINPSNGGEAGNGSRVISKRTNAAGCDVYSMFTLNNKFRFRLDCSDLISSSSFTPDGWIHVAMVYNGTDKRIYVNGVLDQNQQAKSDNIDASARAVHLGARESEGRFFVGQMDDVRIYDRALSATEVTDLFEAPGLPASQLATIDAGSGGTPPPSPDPTPTVNVALTASPLVVTAGQSTTLSWSSTDVTSCSASGGWSGVKAVSGSQTVSPTQLTIYSLTCTGANGSATSGVTVPVGSSTNIVDNLSPGHWYVAPNSRLESVAPCTNGNCPYWGNGGLQSVMNAWSGGAYDTTRDRLMVWGGGHWDYAGNEIYAFDVNTLQWQLLTTPSTSISVDTAYYPDGQPSSRHTYDGLEYLPSVDRFCTVGGVGLYGTGNGGTNQFDCYNLQNNRWENYGSVPSGTRGTSTFSEVDGQGNLWARGTIANGGLSKYNPQTNAWVRYALDNPLDLFYSAAIDTAQNKMYAMGNGNLVMWDLNNPNAPQQSISTSGATGIQGTQYPGMAYHPPSGKIVAWHGGSSVYLFDPNTRVWTRETPAGTNNVTPTAAPGQGTHGRFRYIPSKDVFIAVNAVDENVFFYKLKSSTAPGPTPTPAPTATLSATPTSITAGQSSVLAWSSANASSCSAVGGWSSSSATGGSQTVTPSQTTNYTLTCTGSGGSTSQTATVTVSVPPGPGSLPVGTLVHDGPATPEQLSLLLPVTGSLPQTATASVRYRQTGVQTWTTGHSLHRVRPGFSGSPAAGSVTDVFAWPIIDLAQGTQYEVEVTVVSGSTSDTRTGTFTTRTLPAPAGAPNKIITAGTSSAAIEAAFDNLNPGDVIEFANGTYNVNGAQINRSGTPGNPIYIRGQSRTGVTLVSSSLIFQVVNSSYVVIENMTLQGSGVDSGINVSSRGIEFFDGTPNQTQITVRNVTMNGVDTAIGAYREISQFLAYDNTLNGNNTWTANMLETNATWSDDGIRIPGFGNAAFNNTLNGFGDTLSFASHSGSDTLTQTIGVHFYRNDVRNSGDDLIEADHGHRNMTVYDNRSHNSMTFLSLDPLYGGPLLVARNIAINVGRSPFKWNSTNTGQFVYNNTIVRTTGQDWVNGNFSAEAGWYQANNGGQRAYGYRNNILVYRGDGNQTIRLDNSGHNVVDFTHNSWYPDLIFQWPEGRYGDLLDALDRLPSSTPLFSGTTKRHDMDNITVDNPWTTAVTLGPDYRTEVMGIYIPVLSAGTAPKNSGAVIPNITDGFSGSAPDRGALISGQTTPRYGQR